jgi:uncharacterized protein YceH (UPF0502 family)
MPDLTSAPPPAEASAKWQPLPAIDRRVFGVLIEKGKTTPDQYPMSLNALVSGCNQKSNRYPQMELEPDQVQLSLDRLRQLGVVAEVQGGGRVPRYRHFAYEWLGVNKLELAVMCELLLRGTQTEGELRGRAARMEPIADVAALRPILDALKAKNLLVSLTPQGRGHVVTHNLYEPQEMEKQRSMAHTHVDADEPPSPAATPRRPATPTHSPLTTHHSPAPTHHSPAPTHSTHLDSLRTELESLRTEIAQIKNELTELTHAHERATTELRSIRDSLGG